MPNKVYVARETPLVFKDSGGDAVITLANLAFGVARISARHDLGTGSTPGEFEVRAVVEFETAPALGETVDIWISTSDGTDPDGQEGTVDADLGTLESLKNMLFVGSVVVKSTTANIQHTDSFMVRIPTRYFSVVVHNNSAADNLENTANVNFINVTPTISELQ